MLEIGYELHDRKNPGNGRVDKPRTILLYEVDLNFLNNKLGRDALRQVDSYNQVVVE